MRAAIDAELDARGIAHEWFEDGRTGERRLLFRTGDARGLADSLGSLAEKVEAAHEQAARPSGAPARRRRRSGTEATPDGPEPAGPRADGQALRRGPREGGPRRAGAGARREPREGAVVMRATPPAALAAVAAASALAFAAGDSYAACLASLGGAWAGNLAPALAALPAYVAAHGPVTPGQGPLLAGAVCAVAVWLAWSRAVLAGGNFRQGEEHGSARWLPPAEAARRFSDTRDPDNNIILTRRVGLAVDQSRLKREWRRAKNVLVIGGTGSGKTFSYVMPNALQANQDFLITDTKGTLSRDLGGMFAAHGYEVVVFSTKDPSRSARYNTLAYLRTPVDVIEWVQAFISVTNGEDAKAERRSGPTRRCSCSSRR